MEAQIQMPEGILAGDDLPDGWTLTKLGDVADVIGGGTPKSSESGNFSDNGQPWITPADLSGFRELYIRRGRRDLSDKGLQSCSAVVMPAGTVLMSSRAPIGYLAIAANEICTNQGFKSFVSHPNVDSEFLYFWLMLIKPHLEQMGSGSTFMEISGNRAKEIPLLLAPALEQQRIAAQIKKTLPIINSTCDHLSRVPAILKRFRQAVLAAACSGRLTEDWRDGNPTTESTAELIERIMRDRNSRFDRACGSVAKGSNRSRKAPKNLIRQQMPDDDLPGVPDSWEYVCWDDLADWITYGFTRPMPHVRQGIRIITATNVRDGYIDFSKAEYTTREAFDLLSGKDKPKRDEILITKDGAIRGRAALVETDEPFCISQAVALVRFGGTTAYEPFLLRVIQSSFTQRLIEEESMGTAIPHISITNFGRFPVALPPLAEQKEIVKRINLLFDFASSVEQRVADALRSTDKLTKSILAKAFRGELVPTEAELARREGRDYEPASVLLERIKAARALTVREKAASKTASSRRRMTRSLSATH